MTEYTTIRVSKEIRKYLDDEAYKNRLDSANAALEDIIAEIQKARTQMPQLKQELAQAIKERDEAKAHIWQKPTNKATAKPSKKTK